jgi:2-iminobutanoate/2-iminopropanoate deaminase
MLTDRQALFPEGGPKPGGPYSPAILSGGFVFVAGQVGIDPASGQTASGFDAQARQTLRNVGAVLKAAGCDFSAVVKTTAFLTQPEFFAGFNTVYREFFAEPFPARSTLICQLARADLLVEVEVIARLPG